MYDSIQLAFSALSGATLFIVTQRKFNGQKKIIIFVVSFVVGIFGAETTLALTEFIIGYNLIESRYIGAFICSSLVVSVMIKIINFIDTHKY